MEGKTIAWTGDARQLGRRFPIHLFLFLCSFGALLLCAGISSLVAKAAKNARQRRGIYQASLRRPKREAGEIIICGPSANL